ncbi:transferrin-binding protein-like solute binding protein [Dichelobacter nodosus]|uniref:transferrin-binding protein-like solute binding protein n=1 Tax=Dichelobacter nodosus TaxID=870 RepID=UPI0002F24095|nr:transferrin-binding protein-like solute binding protein [Dichelobacter nodosus]
MDLGKQASQGTTQYVRGEKSKFDRVNNEKEIASATSIYGLEVDNQNPELTNIVVAKKVNKDGKVKLIQYLGYEKAEIKDPKSLQMQNKFNVAKIDGYNLAGKLDEAKIKGVKDQVKIAIASYESLKDTINPDQEKYLASLKSLQAQLEAASASEKSEYLVVDPKHDSGFRTGANYTSAQTEFVLFGDKAATQDAVLGTADKGVDSSVTEVVAPTYDNGVATSTTGAAASGLVGVNFKQTETKAAIQGTEEESQSSTRIFGRQYNDDAQEISKFNSYAGAKMVIPSDTFLSNGLFTGTGKVTVEKDKHDDNIKAVGDVLGADINKGTKVGYHLGVKPQKLEHVQYGRVTGNLDPIKLTADEQKSADIIKKRAAFMSKNADKESIADNFYFYRGTKATTLEQMKALPKDKTLVYQGHALMYGIDNSFHGGKDSNDVPNSFADAPDNSYAIGNFVTANVDLGKEKVTGHVYNVWAKGTEKETFPDKLVKFEGQVFGNTVLGKAERTYKDKTNDADFRASFFGEKASEMGGSFNSVTTDEKYSSDDVWGGVFGAKLAEDPIKEDDGNSFLGDFKPKP